MKHHLFLFHPVTRNNLRNNDSQGSKDFPILSARVVDEESPSLHAPIFEATPLDESQPTATQHLKALLKNPKCRIISVLAIALLFGVIVAAVLLTQQKGAKGLSPSAKALLAEIKPLLSNESLSALNDTDSPQSRSLEWLLERSNFQAWPFHQQIQRYALATIYYATAGPSWSNGGNSWLTDETECRWFQSSEGVESFCDGNGTLLFLNQSNNTLNGKIPDELRFLSSLTVIDLSMNQLSGTIPFDLMTNFTSLQDLVLSNNVFTGTLMNSMDKLTSLQKLDLSSNPSLSSGPLPSEIGLLTKLTYLDLFNNMINSEIPTELGLSTVLQLLSLGANAMTGTIPPQVFACTKLSAVGFQGNSFTGTLPSEFGSLSRVDRFVPGVNRFHGNCSDGTWFFD